MLVGIFYVCLDESRANSSSVLKWPSVTQTLGCPSQFEPQSCRQDKFWHKECYPFKDLNPRLSRLSCKYEVLCRRSCVSWWNFALITAKGFYPFHNYISKNAHAEELQNTAGAHSQLGRANGKRTTAQKDINWFLFRLEETRARLICHEFNYRLRPFMHKWRHNRHIISDFERSGYPLQYVTSADWLETFPSHHLATRFCSTCPSQMLYTLYCRHTPLNFKVNLCTYGLAL